MKMLVLKTFLIIEKLHMNLDCWIEGQKKLMIEIRNANMPIEDPNANMTVYLCERGYVEIVAAAEDVEFEFKDSDEEEEE
jgi:hypothetical protein